MSNGKSYIFYGSGDNLLIDPELARDIGLNESIFLQQIHYWLIKNKEKGYNFKDGRYWTYNSARAWQEQFPFWSERTIKRIINNLEKAGYLISSNYNKLSYDRTKWYTINYEALNGHEQPLGQDDTTIGTTCHDHSDNVTQPIPETSPEISKETNNDHNGFFPDGEKSIDNEEPISFAEYRLNRTVNRDCIRVIDYYLRKYREYTGKNHPRLKISQWDRVAGNISMFSCYDDFVEKDFDLTVSDYGYIIDQHFMTDYKGATDYNINHFVENGIIIRRYYEAGCH